MNAKFLCYLDRPILKISVAEFQIIFCYCVVIEIQMLN